MSPEQASGSAADSARTNSRSGPCSTRWRRGSLRSEGDDRRHALRDPPRRAGAARRRARRSRRRCAGSSSAASPRIPGTATRRRGSRPRPREPAAAMSEVSLRATEPAPRAPPDDGCGAAAGAALAWLSSALPYCWRDRDSRGAPGALPPADVSRSGDLDGPLHARRPDRRVLGAVGRTAPELFETRVENPESRAMGLPRRTSCPSRPKGRDGDPPDASWGDRCGRRTRTTVRDPRLLFGTLAVVPLGGGTPREVSTRSTRPTGDPTEKPRRRAIVDGENASSTRSARCSSGPGWLNDVRGFTAREIGRCSRTPASTSRSLTCAGVNRDLQREVPSVAWSPRHERDLVRRDRSRSDRAPGHDAAGARSPRRAACRGLRPLRHLSGAARSCSAASSKAPRSSRTCPAKRATATCRSSTARCSCRSRASGEESSSRTRAWPAAPAAVAVPAPQRRSPPKRLGEYGGNLSPDGKQGPRRRRKTWCSCRPEPGRRSRSRARTAVLRDLRLLSGRQEHLFRGGGARSPQTVWSQDLSTEAAPDDARGSPAADDLDDGRFSAPWTTTDRWNLYPLDGGRAAQIAGLQRGEEPFQWTADGRLLYVRGSDEIAAGRPGHRGARLRLDPWTGRRELSKEIPAISPAGGGIGTIVISADEKTCFYSLQRYPRSSSWSRAEVNGARPPCCVLLLAPRCWARRGFPLATLVGTGDRRRPAAPGAASRRARRASRVREATTMSRRRVRAAVPASGRLRRPVRDGRNADDREARRHGRRRRAAWTSSSSPRGRRSPSRCRRTRRPERRSTRRR